jgi:hypothetical protein
MITEADSILYEVGTSFWDSSVGVVSSLPAGRLKTSGRDKSSLRAGRLKTSGRDKSSLRAGRLKTSGRDKSSLRAGHLKTSGRDKSRLLQNVQTGSVTHPSSAQWVPGALCLWIQWPGLDAHHSVHLVPKLSVIWAIHCAQDCPRAIYSVCGLSLRDRRLLTANDEGGKITFLQIFIRAPRRQESQAT